MWKPHSFHTLFTTLFSQSLRLIFFEALIFVKKISTFLYRRKVINFGALVFSGGARSLLDWKSTQSQWAITSKPMSSFQSKRRRRRKPISSQHIKLIVCRCYSIVHSIPPTMHKQYFDDRRKWQILWITRSLFQCMLRSFDSSPTFYDLT